LFCVYIGGTRPGSPSNAAATSKNSTASTSSAAVTSSQSLVLFVKSAVTSIVAAVVEALRHLIACIPDDLDLEHRYHIASVMCTIIC
jgi:hypothetical protein